MTALRSGGTPILARAGADFAVVARASESDQDPLDLIKRKLIIAPVVEAGGAGALVIGHLLRHFELAAVAQV